MKPRDPLLPRIFAILAAICVVGAFAIALLYPPMLTLGRLISQIDHQSLVAAQEWIRDQCGDWTWMNLCVPLLARPAWLLPLTLSLVFGGLALTARSVATAAGSAKWKN